MRVWQWRHVFVVGGSVLVHVERSVRVIPRDDVPMDVGLDLRRELAVVLHNIVMGVFDRRVGLAGAHYGAGDDGEEAADLWRSDRVSLWIVKLGLL